MNLKSGLWKFSGITRRGKHTAIYFDDFNEYWQAILTGFKNTYANIPLDERKKAYLKEQCARDRDKRRFYNAAYYQANKERLKEKNRAASLERYYIKRAKK